MCIVEAVPQYIDGFVFVNATCEFASGRRAAIIDFFDRLIIRLFPAVFARKFCKGLYIPPSNPSWGQVDVEILPSWFKELSSRSWRECTTITGPRQVYINTADAEMCRVQANFFLSINRELKIDECPLSMFDLLTSPQGRLVLTNALKRIVRYERRRLTLENIQIPQSADHHIEPPSIEIWDADDE